MSSYAQWPAVSPATQEPSFSDTEEGESLSAVKARRNGAGARNGATTASKNGTRAARAPIESLDDDDDGDDDDDDYDYDDDDSYDYDERAHGEKISELEKKVARLEKALSFSKLTPSGR